jgi:hypothetical protein
MAWRIVKQPNGLLARFSEVVDHFTHYDMTFDEAFDLCLEEWGMPKGEAFAKVARGANAKTPSRWDDAVETIRVIHGDDEAEKTIVLLSAT